MAYTVSVTGLKLKSAFQFPRFAWHAIRSMNQAKASSGNVMADACSKDGYQHTLTAWEDGKSMRQFVYSGPHKTAIGIFHSMATGTVVTYEADEVPDWESALAVWRTDAREVAPPAS